MLNNFLIVRGICRPFVFTIIRVNWTNANFISPPGAIFRFLIARVFHSINLFPLTKHRMSCSPCRSCLPSLSRIECWPTTVNLRSGVFFFLLLLRDNRERAWSQARLLSDGLTPLETTGVQVSVALLFNGPVLINPLILSFQVFFVCGKNVFSSPHPTVPNRRDVRTMSPVQQDLLEKWSV